MRGSLCKVKAGDQATVLGANDLRNHFRALKAGLLDFSLTLLTAIHGQL